MKQQSIPNKVVPTASNMERIARSVSRQEISGSLQGIATQIQSTLTQHLGGANEKFGKIMGEMNNLSFIMGAMVDLLISKGILTREELDAKAKEIAEDAVKKYQEEVAKSKSRLEDAKKDVENAKAGEVLVETKVAVEEATSQA